MHEKQNPIILVLDEDTMTSPLRTILPTNISIRHLHQFAPGNDQTLFIIDPKNLDEAAAIYQRLKPSNKAKSVITARQNSIGPPPVNQPAGTIIIPQCDDIKFMTWLYFLAGIQISRVYIDWFVPKAVNGPLSYGQLQFIRAFDNLPVSNANSIHRAYLQETIHCSAFKLDYLSKQIYQMTPGRLLRVWRYFVLTYQFMQEEARIDSVSRRGKSPLRTVEGDYCEALVRLIDYSYTDLRISAQTEHWVAVWMSAWRKVMSRYLVGVKSKT